MFLTDIARERGAAQSGPPIIMQPRSSFDSSNNEIYEHTGIIILEFLHSLLNFHYFY